MGTIRPSPAVLGGEIHPGNSEWDLVGPTSDPALKLKATWTIGGIMFHVEAFRVCRGAADGFQQVDLDVDAAIRGEDEELRGIFDEFENLTGVFEPEGGFATVNLDNSTYVMFVYPESAS